MKTKKITVVVIILMLLGTLSVTAQSKKMPTANEIITRYEKMADRYESLARKTNSAQKLDRVSEKTFYDLQDDAATLGNDAQYFTASGGELSDAQAQRLLNAMRRIEAAGGQIQRNFQRYGNS
jgi:hypothetical protein